MSASEATIKALKELGLTEYETAAYLALVEGGQISASDVSSRSKVPYSRIYDVLGRLEEKAFIQVQRGRPFSLDSNARFKHLREMFGSCMGGPQFSPRRLRCSNQQELK
jgi:predicted transcriptional regulator